MLLLRAPSFSAAIGNNPKIVGAIKREDQQSRQQMQRFQESLSADEKGTRGLRPRTCGPGKCLQKNTSYGPRGAFLQIRKNCPKSPAGAGNSEQFSQNSRRAENRNDRGKIDLLANALLDGSLSLLAPSIWAQIFDFGTNFRFQHKFSVSAQFHHPLVMSPKKFKAATFVLHNSIAIANCLNRAALQWIARMSYLSPD